ncbi:hypothetical protein DFH06DRAFT_160064 [Mycena polygramma]|nr:hypothetical protein DFH06DRAFT_160064 [Mycena polygramma]
MNATLPADLERQIFEVAALSWPCSIPMFMLVAGRVRIWVEPLLYRTLMVYGSHGVMPDKFKGTHPVGIGISVLLPILHAKGPSFFNAAVRHRIWASHYIGATDEADLLSACSNVENPWLSGISGATVPQLNMPLKRLHCRLKTLFGPNPIDFAHQLFASLTHLEVYDVPDRVDIEVWAALTQLPHLTHLALNDAVYLPMCIALLQASTSLQVLIFWLCNGEMGKGLWENYDGIDVRLVALLCPDCVEDWIMGALTGADYWSRAEDFIAVGRSRLFAISY